MLVGGIGGRLVMRVSGFVTAPELIGSRTENGNLLGEITLPGTLALVVFVGLPAGFAGGWLYALLRPSLAWAARWRGLAYGLVLLAFAGSTFIDANNFDFRRFGPAALNVALFALLFVLFGVAIEPLYARLDAASRSSRVAGVLVWAAVLPALAVVAAAAVRGAQALVGSDPLPLTEANVIQLTIVGLLAALVALRGVRAPRLLAYAVVAALVVLGGLRTVDEVALILGA